MDPQVIAAFAAATLTFIFTQIPQIIREIRQTKEKREIARKEHLRWILLELTKSASVFSERHAQTSEYMSKIDRITLLLYATSDVSFIELADHIMKEHDLAKSLYYDAVKRLGHELSK